VADEAERGRRRDELAWAAVKVKLESAGWRVIDRAVADVLPLARGRGLLDSPWTVPLLAGPGRCFITVDPTGQWVVGNAVSEPGVDVLAASSEPGVCNLSMATAHWVRSAFKAALQL
jgi:hypothetical protein